MIEIGTSYKSHYQQFTPPFDIPDSWVWVRLEEIIRVKSGENLNVRELQSKDIYPVYGGNGINGYYNKCNVAKDTIIIGRVGFYCGSIHKTNSESWVTDNALIVDTDIVNIDINWLCLVLIWANLRKTSNSTAQPVVSGKSIYPVWVPLPSKDEQSRIVDTFDTFIKTIETIEIGKTSVQKLISLTKTKILDLAMQGKLVPQDPADEPAADMLRRINPKAKIITDNPHYPQLPDNWVLT
ncbi:restriction endonuclease subunit S, partial [Bacteroides acidifaciens]|uniref:restriction endonuclease subunit S n=1 Tax=Bacteroides acidifaciens TaxID=85831 RepID=UPI0032200A72